VRYDVGHNGGQIGNHLSRVSVDSANRKSIGHLWTVAIGSMNTDPG